MLNGETAPDPATRQRIAEGFTTAEPPLYDVVIANRIAYEGVNLQTRTCSIIHGDLPHEPATLQQRNGRGQRQGKPLRRDQDLLRPLRALVRHGAVSAHRGQARVDGGAA